MDGIYRMVEAERGLRWIEIGRWMLRVRVEFFFVLVIVAHDWIIAECRPFCVPICLLHNCIFITE